MIPLQRRAERGEILAVVAAGEHAEHGVEHIALKRGKWRRPAHSRIPIVGLEVIHCGRSDGVLGEDIQGAADNAQRFDIAFDHAFDACRGADELFAGQGVEQGVRDAAHTMVGATHTLQPR